MSVADGENTLDVADEAEQGRVHYVSVTDEEALRGARQLLAHEGLLVSLESAHALAYALKLLPTLAPDQHVVVGVSGDGVRDLERLEQRQENGGQG